MSVQQEITAAFKKIENYSKPALFVRTKKTSFHLASWYEKV